MANQEHLAILMQGVEAWNRWREQHQDIHPDLRDANLGNVNLSKANLSNTNLQNTHLSHTGLSYANLSHADLIEADLRHANLYHANLRFAILASAQLNYARLTYADFTNSELLYADLCGAECTGANLRGVKVWDTAFVHLDLREVRGLAALDHLGPSRVELHTVQLPPDGSALHFLRGAGVPDEWIDDYRARMMHPIQYHSCFISYASKDDTLAQRLYADLQTQGVRCWFAPHDMKIGDKIRPRIDEAIHLQDKLLLVLSKHALASDWVESEVEAAFEKEAREKRLVLFPICIDGSVLTTGQAWAASLRRSSHIGDFANWTDPQAYERAFERLLRDLKKASK